MTAALCILLCAVGHLVRDGWPSFRQLETRLGADTWPAWLRFILNPTQIARVTGGLLVFLGALAVHAIGTAALLAGAVLVGFWTDMKHGDGQSATGWRDAGYLLLSGVTSLVPLALAGWWIGGSTALLIMLIGLLKPPIWFGAWAVRPDRWWPFLDPTRVGAILFGASVGALLGFVMG